jgi:hypothetical protein
MPAPPDRPIHLLEQDHPAFPLPPLNFFAQSSLMRGSTDLRWDPPTNLSANSCFSIIGVNLYRSFDSEFGPFYRLNDIPVGSNYWRDSDRIAVALQEDVSRSFIARGPTDPDACWIFRTAHKPIVIQPWLGTMESASLNVYVTINGVQARVQKIDAYNGEVWLDKYAGFDVASQQVTPAVLPMTDTDVILATYRWLEHESPTNLNRWCFYRVTTVALDVSGQLIETPLDRAAKADNHAFETTDWIWREAIRRNRFLLVQGGERVKVFLRKTVGMRCGCYSDLHEQPASDCLVCYGTGIIGGYDGPYDIMIAPDDSERGINQTPRGRQVDHDIDTWTGPSPLLCHRDFIVKLNGDRYAIGPVRMPNARGMRLQQMFHISCIDEPDIRFSVPVIDTSVLVSPQTRWTVPGQGEATPMITERISIPDDREFRGNTVAFENAYRH